jgi:hypothetical protein
MSVDESYCFLNVFLTYLGETLSINDLAGSTPDWNLVQNHDIFLPDYSLRILDSTS